MTMVYNYRYVSYEEQTQKKFDLTVTKTCIRYTKLIVKRFTKKCVKNKMH